MASRGVDLSSIEPELFPAMLAATQQEAAIDFLKWAYQIRSTCDNQEAASNMIEHLKSIYFVEGQIKDERDIMMAAEEFLRLQKQQFRVTVGPSGSATMTIKEK